MVCLDTNVSALLHPNCTLPRPDFVQHRPARLPTRVTGDPRYSTTSHRGCRRRSPVYIGADFSQVLFRRRYAAAWWNFTLTSLETPASCIVTPYIAWADSIVFLEWVMTMN